MNTSAPPAIEAQASHLKDMMRDGVIVLKERIPYSKIPLLIEEVNKIRKIVMAKISHMDRPLKTYSDITERQLNRLDYRSGFTPDIFNEVAVPIIPIVKEISLKISAVNPE